MNAEPTRTKENEMSKQSISYDTKAIWALDKALKLIALMDIKIDTQGVECARQDLRIIRDNRIEAKATR
tara:strand:- start:455 stop:661 length:207 start_codon:yes stop_codon:yes gene_type:complete